ncbi:unnamed protein product [Ixodes hexagonus]
MSEQGGRHTPAAVGPPLPGKGAFCSTAICYLGPPSLSFPQFLCPSFSDAGSHLAMMGTRRSNKRARGTARLSVVAPTPERPGGRRTYSYGGVRLAWT